MIGNYWSIGIALTPHPAGNQYIWEATLEFMDCGVYRDERINSTRGTLSMSCWLSAADLIFALPGLVADAKALGIEFVESDGKVRLYMQGDGEWNNIHYPPDWRRFINRLANHLDFVTIYKEDA